MSTMIMWVPRIARCDKRMWRQSADYVGRSELGDGCTAGGAESLWFCNVFLMSTGLLRVPVEKGLQGVLRPAFPHEYTNNTRAEKENHDDEIDRG